MRNKIILILVCFTLIVQSRPSQNEEDKRAFEEEVEYEVEPDERDSRLQPEIQESASEEQNKRLLEMLNPNAGRMFNKVHNNAEISDNKLSKNKQERETNTDVKIGFEGFQFPKRRQTLRYFNSDQQEPLRITNRNANTYKSNHNSILTDEAPNKRTLKEPKKPLNDDNDMLFENAQDKMDYNNEPVDVNQRSPKQYNSVMQPENRAMTNSRERDNERIYYSRDRRNTDNSQPNPDSSTNIENQEQKENINPDAEDGEAAIKKHIQKLSSEELQDLMNSLSEEKRNLLKKIIDDSNLTENDAVHKREITKKAEAVQDNSYNDDTKMLTGSVSVTDSVVSQSTDTSDTNKPVDSSKSDNSDTSNTKNAELSNDQSKAMDTFQDPSVQQISDDAVSPTSNIEPDKSKIVSIQPAAAKNANKREINEKDLADSKVDQSYICPQAQDSQVIDDDEQLQFDQEIKTFKRDVDQQAELDFKMKSLEDSFPNSDSYDESSGLRVKRTDADVNLKKRSAALLPDSKVGFFPYRSESDDDDEEGNEFDDEGFYERAHVCNKNVEENAPVKHGNDRPNNENRQTQISEFNNNSKLGTDTDSVLSGMNEVDENLMFNSGTRNRRTTEDNNLSNNEDVNAMSVNSKSSDDDNKVMSESNVNNAPNYQESDAFGPLPQSYGGDLGRYKRIRRVKQSHAEEPTSDTQVS